MGEFSGIDPQALNGMTGSFKTDKDRLRQGAAGIKSNFERFGIDTQPLTELLAICGWFDDQMPMLTRRFHLAVAAETPYPGAKNMVSVDESKVGMTAEAQKNGKDLGDKVKKALEDGDTVPADLMAALEQNAGDGDFVAAFYGALGPERLSWLSSEMGDDHPYDGRYKDHPEQRTHDRDVIAKTLGTFTQVAFEGQSEKDKQASWNKWFDTFALLPEQGFRPDRLMPLLAGGTYDKDFLVALGDRAFSHHQKTNEQQWMGGSGDKNPWTSDHYTQLFDAIAKNPEASGEWMDHNHDDIQIILYPHGPWALDEPKSRAAAFVKLAHAGTIDLRLTNEPLAEKNTTRLMFDNYKHMNGDLKGIHPVAGVDYLYTQILQSYWKDMERGITSPVSDKFWMGDATMGGFTEKRSKWDEKAFLDGQDPSHLGLEAGAPMWQALMAEGARDPKGAGEMTALFDAYRMDLDTLISHSKRSDDGAVEYLTIKEGLMLNSYGQAFDSAMSSIEGDANSWAEGVNAARGAMIDAAFKVAAAGATGGGAAAATAGKETAIETVSGAAESLLTGWAKELVKVKAEQVPGGLAKTYKALSDIKLDTSWRDTYRRKADLQLAADPENGLKGGYDPVITKPITFGPAHGESTTYSGDPNGFIKVPGDNFLTTDGEVMDLDKMTPQQMTAYSDWLQDYAVAAKIKRDGFDTTQIMQNVPE